MSDELQSFVVFGDTWAGIALLDDHQKATLLQALYAEHGFCDPPALDRMTQSVFNMMLPRMRANRAKYMDVREKRRQAGRKGGSHNGEPEHPRGDAPTDADDFAKQTEANRSKPKQNDTRDDASSFAKQKTPVNGSGYGVGYGVGYDVGSVEEGDTGRFGYTEESLSPSNPAVGTPPQPPGGGSERALSDDDADASSRPKTGKSAKADAHDVRIDDFNAFWEACPRKVGKSDALKAWGRLAKAGELPELSVLTDALGWQKMSAQWQDSRYIPHPASWLNGHRWEDEQTPERSPERGDARASPNGRLFSREQAAMDETYKNSMEVLQELRERGVL